MFAVAKHAKSAPVPLDPSEPTTVHANEFERKILKGYIRETDFLPQNKLIYKTRATFCIEIKIIVTGQKILEIPRL